MSEKQDADEVFETDDSTNSINRRRFGKTLGIAGGATAFGLTGLPTVSAKNTTESNAEPKIDIVTVTDEEVEASIAQRAFSNSESE